MKIENTRYRYPLNLQLFAEGDPEPDPTPTPEPEKTFTQAELDQIIADRIARERKKTEKFADYDDLKTKLSELEKAEEERKKAELSETERLAADLEAAKKAAQEAQEARERAETSANKRLIKAEFKTLARDLNIRQDALEDAYKLADLSNVGVDEDGVVTGIEDAVRALTEAKPYLVEKAPTQPKRIGEPSGNTNDDDRQVLEQQLADAKKAKDFSKVIELSNKLLNK